MASESCYENLLSQTECQHIVENALEGAILIKYEIVPASSDTIGYLGDYYKLKTTVLLVSKRLGFTHFGNSDNQKSTFKILEKKIKIKKIL